MHTNKSQRFDSWYRLWQFQEVPNTNSTHAQRALRCLHDTKLRWTMNVVITLHVCIARQVETVHVSCVSNTDDVWGATKEHMKYGRLFIGTDGLFVVAGETYFGPRRGAQPRSQTTSKEWTEWTETLSIFKKECIKVSITQYRADNTPLRLPGSLIVRHAYTVNKGT